MAAAALALARAARAQLQALQPTVEQQQAEIDRVQLRASECGMVEKTAGKSGVAGMIQRGWKKWITSPLGASLPLVGFRCSQGSGLRRNRPWNGSVQPKRS